MVQTKRYHFWKDYRRRVREYLVHNGRLGIVPIADNTTFEEFATYVVLTRRNGEKRQVHWRQMYDLCHPRNIKFDYIRHYEILRKDALFIVKMICLGEIVQFPNNLKSTSHI